MLLGNIRFGTMAALLPLPVLGFLFRGDLPAHSEVFRAAYFAFEQEAPDGKLNRFVFKLEDPARISEARAILATHSSNDSVHGVVIARGAAYNPEWSFHLEPASVGFFEFQIEVCDANVTYVEKHLDEVGGSFLPNRFWCPWSSRLVGEVTDQVNSTLGAGGE